MHWNYELGIHLNGFAPIFLKISSQIQINVLHQGVAELLMAYKEMGCCISLKMHFLHSHLEFFPENLGAVGDEPGEKFCQDIQSMEKRYKGVWNEGMMGDDC